MNKVFLLSMLGMAGVLLAGCAGGNALHESVGGKNLDLSGYVMLGELESANPETMTPLGRLIVGRVTYRSRVTGIGKDQKVPDTAAFRAVRSTSLFGSSEVIVEYDFTASTAQSAAAAAGALEQVCAVAAAEIAH